MRQLILGSMFALCAFATTTVAQEAKPEGGIDTKNVEKIILDAAKSKGIVSVTCPEFADGAIGNKFNCSSKHSDGTTYTFEVTVSGENGQIEFKDVPNAPAN